MNLTRVKVRGKRGKTEAKDESAHTATTTHTNLSRGKHGQDQRGARTRKQSSCLAQLPLEVLEHVFIASRNLSLPLANRELYHLLSSDFIKCRLIGAAFGPTWDAYHGCDIFEVKSYDGWQADADRIEGDPGFQSAVLACSWAKFPLLLQAFDVWARQHAKGRVYFTIPALNEQRLEIPPQPGSLYETAYNNGANKAGRAAMSMRHKLAFDLERFQALVPDLSPCSSPAQRHSPSGLLNNSPVSKLCALLGMHLEVHPGTRIPDDLLSGPFESATGIMDIGLEKLQRLFWLVRGGARLQEDQSWDLTCEGFTHILCLIAVDAKAIVAACDGRCPLLRTRILDDQRPALAAQLSALFHLLGVYDCRWPRYKRWQYRNCLLTLISDASPQQAFVMGQIAAVLDHTPDGMAFNHYVRQRWRPQHQSTVHNWSPHRARTFDQIWRNNRAELFLCAPPVSAVAQLSSPLAGTTANA